MADSDAVDVAVIAKLSEPTLAGFMPDGVFYDVAPGGTKFVIVSLLAHEDSYVFEGTAFERHLYLIKAVQKSNTITAEVRSAARRIHALMQDGALSITGYSHVKTKRLERIVIAEPDDIDRNIRWMHLGGHYEVLVTPT